MKFYTKLSIEQFNGAQSSSSSSSCCYICATVGGVTVTKLVLVMVLVST